MLNFDTIVAKIIGTRSERELKKLKPILEKINALEATQQARSDDELRAQTPALKERLANGAPIDDLIPDAFSLVREVSRRKLGMRHFDVQMLGGMVLHRGSVAEMKTGEGKTLVATLPAYLNALSGKGVHVVTVNDYLASRDADWMGTIYKFLGLRVGKILSNERSDRIKREAYAADITYGTNNEFGFDYLRDNMKFKLEDYVQRGHNFAIVDEVDSILVDEARTPLIISGPANDNSERYYIIDSVVPLLQAEIDYLVDEKNRSVTLTDSGVDRVEQRLGIDNLYDVHNMEILHHVNQALKAHTLFKRDRDYVVQDGKVVIVDEHTHRLMHGRRWSDGLHQAVEAKEKLNIEAESQTYATITFQNYFRMYSKLSGMTGTAETEAEEFQKIYNLHVVVVPTNRAVVRADHSDMVYKTQGEKFKAVMADIEEAHGRGQPILVGTASVEKSEIVSRLLKSRGIPHEVLNARNHAREAEIVSQAGRLKKVTVSTNMAGRGTDIKLGGDPEFLAKAEANPDAQPEQYEAALARYRAECEAEKVRVLEAGGLHIVGTERHESRRIDNQLRGRSGRQGDPGSSRFYLSLEDDLLRIFGSDKLVGWMERMGLKDDEPIEHRWINRSIENAQKKVEGHNFNIRKNLLEYDDVLNQQRKSVYDLRRRILQGDGVAEILMEAVNSLVDDIIDEVTPEKASQEEWDLAGLRERLDRVFGLQLPEKDEEIRDWSWDELYDRVREDAIKSYETRRDELGESFMETGRLMMLTFTDQHWKDHLLAMDRLRDGIGLRGYGQKNPLLEYKKEGFNYFQLMNALRDEAVISRLLRLERNPLEGMSNLSPKLAGKRLAAGDFGEDDEDEAPSAPTPSQVAFPGGMPLAIPAGARPPAPPPRPVEPVRPQPGEQARAFAAEHGIGRNDPCPCGSGKKFKKCCYQEPAADAGAVDGMA